MQDLTNTTTLAISFNNADPSCCRKLNLKW